MTAANAAGQDRMSPPRLRSPLLATLAPFVLATAAAAQDGDGVAAVEQRTEQLAMEASAAVVGVSAVIEASGPRRLELPGLVVTTPAHGPLRLESTGFLVTADGHVATTFEMARMDARFRVRFADGTVRAATFVGADEPFRLAVLRTTAPETSRPVSRAADLEPGRRALGWFFGAADGVSGPSIQLAAVRAATSCRSPYDAYLSAPIPFAAGHAGGPLLARDGGLLGMIVGWTKAPCAGPGEPSQRAGEALFVRGADVLSAAEQIARTGLVRRARLGVVLDGDTSRIEHCIPAGPAERAGLAEGDVIVRIGTTDVEDGAQIAQTLLRRRAGDRLRVDVRRGGAIVSSVVALEDVGLPPMPATAPIPGTTLEVAQKLGDSGDPVQVVTFDRVEAGSAAGDGGVQPGDQLVSVDGRDVSRFLARHRVRSSVVGPAEIVVVRDGATHTIVLRR